jgi:hypothetical protein
MNRNKKTSASRYGSRFALSVVRRECVPLLLSSDLNAHNWRKVQPGLNCVRASINPPPALPLVKVAQGPQMHCLQAAWTSRVMILRRHALGVHLGHFLNKDTSFKTLLMKWDVFKGSYINLQITRVLQLPRPSGHLRGTSSVWMCTSPCIPILAAQSPESRDLHTPPSPSQDRQGRWKHQSWDKSALVSCLPRR